MNNTIAIEKDYIQSKGKQTISYKCQEGGCRQDSSFMFTVPSSNGVRITHHFCKRHASNYLKASKRSLTDKLKLYPKSIWNAEQPQRIRVLLVEIESAMQTLRSLGG